VCQCPASLPTICSGNAGNVCTDTTSDPNNCGGCSIGGSGIVCAIPDAGEPASCSAGVCAD
jgi:hypothetical protein